MTAADHRGDTRLASARSSGNSTKPRPPRVPACGLPALRRDLRNGYEPGRRAPRERTGHGNASVRCASPDARTHAGGHRLPHRWAGHHGGSAELLAAEAQRRGVPLYFALARTARGGRVDEHPRGQDALAGPAADAVHGQRAAGSFPARDRRCRSNSGAAPRGWRRRGCAARRVEYPAVVCAGHRGRSGADAAGVPRGRGRGATDRRLHHAGRRTNEVEVLYYQGALQWGYRYLLAALEGDPSFHLTSILNPPWACG